MIFANILAADERRIESQLAAALALPAVINMIPFDCQVYTWDVKADGISACIKTQVHPDIDDGTRAGMRDLAARLGMTYDEKPHSGGRYKVSVTGSHDGVRIELWDLTPQPGNAGTGAAS